MIDCLLDMLEDVRPRFGLHFERLGDGNEGKHVGLPLLLDGLGDKMPNVNDVRCDALIFGVLVVELSQFEIGLPQKLYIFVRQTAGTDLPHLIFVHLSNQY